MAFSTKFTVRGSAAAMAAALLFPSLAQAQQDPTPVEEPAAQPGGSEIVVTGSRVRGEAPVGSAVTALGRAEIETTSAVTIDRMIKEIPQNFDLGVSENSRGQSGGNGNITYGNSVNLRGIGPYATLVIVDGHRVTNNSRSIDPSTIPSLGVERVEVIADGASAIYGSDAVAGVVNIIPRRSLDGAEGFARAGVAGDGAMHEYALGAALGKVFDRGQLMVAFEHVERSNLSGDDRPFFTSNQTANGYTDGRTTRCYPGTIVTGAAPNQIRYAIPAGGVTQATAGSLVAGTTNRCEGFARQDLIPRQTYNSVNGTGTFHIADAVTLSFDAFYSKREFYRKAAFSSNTISVPSTNAFFVRPAGFTGTSYNIDYQFRELPVNDSSGFAESWQITPKISIKLPGDFQFEALAGYGSTNDFSGSYFGLNNAAINAALASPTAATAFDPYGLGRTSPALYTSLADQIFLAPTNGKLKTYQATINGSLIQLPGGSVKVAAGYERQDFDVALGSARGAPTTPVVFRNFGRTVDSVYGELYVPIFGPSNAIGGFQRLELNGAVRYDKYSDVGSTTNPKIGINWVPVDGLKLRGSYGTSFRAPTLPEIYGNSNNLFPQDYSLPGGGTVRGVALSGQNLDLQPETARTWSVGADLNPARGLNLGVTYWDVKYENQVSANLSNLAILGQASFFAGTNVLFQGAAASAELQKYLNQGIALNSPLPAGGASAITVFVDGRSRNLGVSRTKGIDFTVDYRTDVGPDDRLGFNASGTYLTEYMAAVSPAAPLIDRKNTIFNPLQFKARAAVTWDHGPLSTRLAVTHIGGYDNTLATPVQKVESFNPVDLGLTWKIGDVSSSGALKKGMSFGIEVRNLLDEKPPFVFIAPNGNGSGGYDATASDPIGRFFAASVRAKF